ncbi:hypothetical protein T02_3450 [Trichinella nativa]|uniref:Uncharacterized protein n=1 Tax=Trichinella nativa TaxID=6335 RepID=A0A0V1L8H0_9BILA|nr:hypothetical protein T02_3450 [Trichinella nativa]
MQNKGELCVQAQTNGTTYYQRYVSTTAHVNTQEINHFDGTFAAPPWHRRRKKHCDYLWNCLLIVSDQYKSFFFEVLFYMSTEYKA